MLEELDLAQGALGENLLAEYIGDLLNGDTLVCLVVYCGAVVLRRGNVSSKRVVSTMSQGGVASKSEVSEEKNVRRGRGGGVPAPDNAVGTLAKLLRYGVSLVDNEILVEHLEHLASL